MGLIRRFLFRPVLFAGPISTGPISLASKFKCYRKISVTGLLLSMVNKYSTATVQGSARGSQLMIWVYEYLNKNIFFRIFYIFPYFLYFFVFFIFFYISYIFLYVCCFVSNICLLNSINVLKLFYTLKKMKYYRDTYFSIVLKKFSYLTYLF